MADYPSIGYDLKESKFEPVSGMQIDRADDGKVRQRSFHVAEQFNLTIVHTYITQAERDQIMAFWTASGALQNTFTRVSDGQVFTVLMSGRPQDQHLTGNYWKVTTLMTGELQ